MSLHDDVGGQVVLVMVVMIVTVMVVKMMIDAGQGMYYDKAFEQTQKTGGCVVKVPEPTKVDCLYDLHFKYASRVCSSCRWYFCIITTATATASASAVTISS